MEEVWTMLPQRRAGKASSEEEEHPWPNLKQMFSFVGMKPGNDHLASQGLSSAQQEHVWILANI